MLRLYSIDNYFLVCKALTLLVCLPWPLTLLPTVMSLVGYVPPETSASKIFLAKLCWSLVLVYPLVFFGVIFFAERVIAPIHYAAGLTLAYLPLALSAYVLYWLFGK